MSTRPRPSLVRTTTARLAVAGAAGLASVMTFAPMAVAADSPAGDTGSTETSDPSPSDTPSPAPTDTPNPAPSDPAPTTSAPTDPPSAPTPGDHQLAPASSTASAKAKASAEAEDATITPDFGYNKFRVGVKIADGSTVPDGVTTLGSKITIVETGPGVTDGSKTTTCTTTIDEGDAGTFCDHLNVVGGGWDPALYLANFGDVVTVTQTTVNSGLTIVDGVKTVVPTCNQDEQFCGEDDNRGDVLLTDAPVPPTRPHRHPHPHETGALPNTGGPDAELLALGLAMVGSGGWLIGRGRTSRRRSDAVV